MAIRTEPIGPVALPKLGDVVDEKTVAMLVRQFAASRGGLKEAGEAFGCSAQLVHMVANGKRSPTDKMLEALSLEALPVLRRYRRK